MSPHSKTSFDHIRKLLALRPDAQALILNARLETSSLRPT